MIKMLSFSRTQKIIILLKNQFPTKRQHYCFRAEGKFNMKQSLYNNKKLNECIKHGISVNTILANNWIFNLDLSKWNIFYSPMTILKHNERIVYVFAKNK